MHRVFTLTILLLFVAVPVSAGSVFKSSKQAGKWLAYYYKKPSPDKILDALHFLSRSGLLDKKKSQPKLFGFFAGVFHENRGQVNEWIAGFRPKKEAHFGVVILGLWYADLPQSKALVNDILDQHPGLNQAFSFLNESDPVSLAEIPLQKNPWALQAYWGNFMATGDPSILRQIIAPLEWINEPEGSREAVLAEAAKWSLTTNATLHSRVLKICKRELAEQSDEVAAQLEEIIDRARRQRKK